MKNNRVAGGKRPIKWRALSALGISSTALYATTAIAGVTTMGLVFTLTAATQGSVSNVLVKWVAPIAAATAGGSTATPTTVVVTKTAATDTAAAGIPKMELGMNIAGPSYFRWERVFMNLLAGSAWQYVDGAGKWLAAVPADRLDAQQNIIKLEGKEQVVRAISIPNKAYTGASVDVICRWDGTAGTMAISGMGVKNIKYGKNQFTYTFVLPEPRATPNLYYSKVSPSDPVRNLDCRETDADPKTLFHPAALADIGRYNTIRFLAWSNGVNLNIANVTWAGRTKPGDGVIQGADTVAIEYMVQIANETKTNPWFVIPWNASEDYVRNMAIYVRDNLDPALKAHVELSNEVWNWNFPQTTQAMNEGKARGLHTDGTFAYLYRYGERTGEVMDIWTSVYAGKMDRLVRVIAFQNGNTFGVNVVMQWNGGSIAKKVDAVATAPYFGYKLAANTLKTPAQIDNFFNVTVDKDIELAITYAKNVKAAAQKYNLRFMTYEAGHHYLSDADVPQLQTIMRDPRMGKAYTRYLSRWKNELGDLITLLSDYGPIDKYGAWGLQEHVGQPLNLAPKANAVELFRRSYITK